MHAQSQMCDEKIWMMHTSADQLLDSQAKSQNAVIYEHSHTKRPFCMVTGVINYLHPSHNH